VPLTRRSVHNNTFRGRVACYYVRVHSLSNKQLGFFALVIIVIGLILVFLGAWPTEQPQTSTNPTSTSGVRVPPPQPVPTASDTTAAQSPDTFQLLVSYVNSGFEPKSATIQAGETVRFTNNSTSPLWLVSVATAQDPLYPGISSCGASTFDSCGPLQPGQNWQFTFAQKGTWEVGNGFDKSKSASITVQ
jgi:plastocyanin